MNDWRQRVERQLIHRQRWVDALTAETASRPAWVQRRLRPVLRKLAGSITADEIMRNRDAALLCFPFCCTDPADDSAEARTTPGDLADQARTGLDAWYESTLGGRRGPFATQSIWIYLLFVWLLCGLVMLFLSVWVIPVFGSMYNDFGLNLPGPTRIVIAGEDWIRAAAVLIVVAALTGGLLILTRTWWVVPVATFVPKNWRIELPRAIRPNALPRWAGDVATLLRWQWPTGDAAELADNWSAGWLARVDHREHPLMVAALSLPGSSAATTMTQLAAISRDRNHAGSRGWVEIVSAVALLVVGLLVAIIVLTLYLPLVGLVSALS